MHSYNRSRQSLGRRQEGIALIVTLLVMMLVSVLMVGFVASIVADTRASGFDRDQTQAYASAHAGLEQITTDLSRLFETDFSPNGAQVAAVRTNRPTMPGFSFVAPGDTVVGSGYMVAPRFTVTTAGPTFGDPLPEDPVNGSAITSGPYQGFRGIITPYDITVTSRGCPAGPPCETTRGGAEVRMRRTLQTVAIPVFQFGMFSETDVAFHAGGSEDFDFAGRVHTNGNLFLAAATNKQLTIGDRITAVGDIIRTHLPNGLPTATGYTGIVRIPTTIVDGSVIASNTYRNLKVDEGSLTGTLPRVELPAPGNLNPKWTGVSVATYKSNIRNGDTGAKRLDLPIVGDRDGNGHPDAQPIDLIRRPPPTEASTSLIYAQRYFGQASLRILLSDSENEIKNLPTVLSAGAVNLEPSNATSGLNYAGPSPPSWRPPLAAAVFADATAAGAAVSATGMPADVYKTYRTAAQGGAPLLGGWIKIEMQLNNNTWQDVTQEILSLGIAGRNLADNNISVASRWNSIPSGTSDTCAEPNPNAIIRLQRVRDVPVNHLLAPCGFTTLLGVNTVSTNPTDYFPNTLYDPREANVRDGLADTTDIVLGGVMHYIELDVNNLRKWLLGQFAAAPLNAGSGVNAKNDNGYIVYFSDRRNNKSTNVPATAVETGEYGWEHTVNLANAAGNDYTDLDPGEDANGNGTSEEYGGSAKAAHIIGTSVPSSPLVAGALVTTTLTGSTARLVARANRAIFFRRALKIVNGGIYTTTATCTPQPSPCNNIIAPGLTVVSENPVYLQGNYNATSASVVAEPNVAAAIIADAVTILSNRWNDIRSFNSPTNSTLSGTNNDRQAETTGYRVAIVTGKTLPFPKPAYADASFGSDGGVHNFLRSLEDWTGDSQVTRYRGSMVSFFISRQATGSFKCCDADVYNRGDRDWAFDTDFLLPARLPPGTPMFRDVNTLTFRQLLRPTQ